MANEIQYAGPSGVISYVLIRNSIGLVWNINTSTFQVYSTALLANYIVSATEQGTASGYYAGSFPVAIPPGTYNIVAFIQGGVSPVEGDALLAEGNFEWNGAATASLADVATSGQISQFLPVRLERGSMVPNYGIYFKSSTDHITPFVSGIVSGQIARDGGAFTAFQSGVFSEVGLGFYNLTAITSGDLLANSVKMVFTAVGVSGGTSDPVAQFSILQRVSGQNI